MGAKTRGCFQTLALAICCATGLAQIEPPHHAGQSVTGAFEGWFKNSDGTFSILLGYFNRNYQEEIDIPIGPNNHIEPGEPDRGQPTHFLSRRQWGVFRVIVPADFGVRKLTWTLNGHGQSTTIPMSLDPRWEISPFFDVGMGNTPPVLRFVDEGTVQGPLALGTSLTAGFPQPVELKVRATDDAKILPGSRPPPTPPIVLTWSKYRGPGKVTFSTAKPPIDAAGLSIAWATFSEPGEYTLLLVANDWSGDGGRGFQCCWTTAHVTVQSRNSK